MLLQVSAPHAHSDASEPPTQKPTDADPIIDPISFEPLVRDLIRSETLKLALVSLVERIDWSKASPEFVASAIQTLSEDRGISTVVEDWANSEHREICACCRAKARIERKEAA